MQNIPLRGRTDLRESSRILIRSLALGEVQDAARSVRIKTDVVNAGTVAQFELSFDAVLVCGDPFFLEAKTDLALAAARHRLPAMFNICEFVQAGGLMSYGTSLTEAFRQAGVYAGRILRGQSPSELPILQPTKFDLVINLKTAKALKLELPPTLIALADEVIE
jgi:putative tryptophan/tyrosine transport system substrate-binding protein